MISGLTGELRRVEEGSVLLQVGPVLFELMVPAADVPILNEQLGREMTFHTVLYLEGDAARGNLEPRLIGFLDVDGRRFFDLFTTVKGIGPRTALRALTVPVGEIAAAIEERNNRFLVGLNGVGKRTAELIIAELSGKLGRFVRTGSPAARPGAHRWSPEEEAALAFAMSPQMGLRRADAERLLERVKAASPQLVTAEQILPEMLRLYSAMA